MGFFSKWKKKIDDMPAGDPMYRGTMVLLYNLSREKGMHFEIMCEDLGIEVVYVEKEEYLQPVGALANISGIERVDQTYEGEGFEEIMGIMKNFTGMAMANFKDKMRRTTGVASFDLEVNIHDKNKNMNSIEIRDMLYAKKHPNVVEEEKETVKNAAENEE